MSNVIKFVKGGLREINQQRFRTMTREEKKYVEKIISVFREAETEMVFSLKANINTFFENRKLRLNSCGKEILGKKKKAYNR